MKTDTLLSFMKQETYLTPRAEVLELCLEEAVLTGSTGETFKDPENYGGEWS